MTIKDAILNKPLKRQDIATPFWSTKDQHGDEIVDGHLALQDVPSDELALLQNALRDTPALLTAAVLCKALIDKRTGERIFEDTDREAMLKRGSAELTPLMKPVMEFFGMDIDIEALKKSSEMSPNKSIGTGSVREAYIRR